MKINELRRGNLIEITQNDKDSLLECLDLDFNEDIPDSNYFEIASISEREVNLYFMREEHEFDLNDLKPIPLTEEWLLKMKDNKYKDTFPDWIKFVHEAQNWYYWNHNKTELTIK